MSLAQGNKHTDPAEDRTRVSRWRRMPLFINLRLNVSQMSCLWHTTSSIFPQMIFLQTRIDYLPFDWLTFSSRGEQSDSSISLIAIVLSVNESLNHLLMLCDSNRTLLQKRIINFCLEMRICLKDCPYFQMIYN